MSGISTGVGLFSGIDTNSLIQQLLAVDAQPKQLIQQRIAQLQTQQAAYLGINASLLALQSAAGAFNTDKTFDKAIATSSDSTILTATAQSSAPAGTYSLSIARLVSTQQQLSKGFADRSNSGLGATKFTFETGGGNLVTHTTLAELNGGTGAQRGKIVLTDTSGGGSKAVTIDLSTAVTLDDAVTAINNNGQVSVKASIEGDHLKLTAGAGVSSFTVGSATDGSTAEGLGIAGASTGGTLTGSDIRTLSLNTALSVLNDNNGVHIRDGAADFKITASDGSVLNIDLGLQTHTVTQTDGTQKTITDQARATTLGDVVNIINKAATAKGINFSAGISADGKSLVINDNTGGSGQLQIVSGTGRSTAEDLGIATSGFSGSSFTGQRLISGLDTRLVRNLSGGAGISGSSLTVTDRAGNSKTITLSAAALSGSVSDLMNSINSQLADNTVGGTVVKVKARINKDGNGLGLDDTSGGSGNFAVSGSAGDALGLTTANAGSSTIEGSSLQLKWISRATQLSTLNQGQGVGTGTIRVTDSSGSTHTIDITSSYTTVDDLLNKINSQFPSSGLVARINDHGDGLEIDDTLHGSSTLKVEDVTGTVAKSLNLTNASTTATGTGGSTQSINGSFEETVAFDPTDSLDTIVSKINAAGVGVTAAVIQDGSSGSPYRLSFTARNSGSGGQTLIDTGNVDLGLTTLNAGQDAIAFFGNADPSRAVLLSSSSNTFNNVIQGVSITAHALSSTPVQLSVTRDTASIESDIQSFISAFNTVLTTIDKQDSYDDSTKTKGPLLGDSTVESIRSQLLNMVQGTPIGVTGQFTRLFQVGITIGDGAQLQFDASKFEAAYAQDPAGLKNLFAASTLVPKTPKVISPGVTTTPDPTDVYSQQGVAEQISKLAAALTDTVTGTLTGRNTTLQTQIDQQQARSDDIDKMLANKQQQYQQQFLAMEEAIGNLKTQSGALSQLGG